MNLDVTAGSALQTLIIVLGSAGLYRLVNAFTARNKSRVDAATDLSSAATDFAKELKLDAAQARDRAKALNAELDASKDKVAEMAMQVRSLSYELDLAFARLRRWKAAILDEDIGRQQLIVMVESDLPSTNGDRPIGGTP